MIESRLKVVIAYLVSPTLFWIGDKVSIIMNLKYMSFLYVVYNGLMIASSDIEEWAGVQIKWTTPC